jgi:hypothetical protein
MSMGCRLFLSLSLMLFCSGGLVGGAAAGDGVANQCNASPASTPLATETASAGLLANLGNRADSIRGASKKMLNSAIEMVRSDASPQRIIFKSIPELSDKTTADDQMCERHERATRKEPLTFDEKRFATVDDLTDWIMDFTRGKGTEGKLLYKQCPGKCSPQYTWWIEPRESALHVNARVVCGRPRDRDGNNYRLSIELAAACPAEASQ